MNYLSQLTEDEVRYICSVVPYQDTIGYFTKNPKEFAKIRPGFRVKAISKTDASKLLFSYRSTPFISYFIEKHISDWLSEIKEHYTKRIEAGDSKDIALIHTLPFCFFAENVSLYFKLANEEYSEEYIALLSATVRSIKEATDEQDRLKDKIKAIDSDYQKLQTELKSKNAELDKSHDKLISRLQKIDELTKKVFELESFQATAQRDKQLIKSLSSEIQTYVGRIEALKEELSEMKSGNLELEKQIKEELERQQNARVNEQTNLKKPKRPDDMDEFKDYLGYNLTNIGVSNDAEYYPLLIAHLGKILFLGVPVIVNRVTGGNILKCVANTIIGRTTYRTLTFSKDVTMEEISRFFFSDDRIVCLDNFIGNYNETELIPLVEKHRDKIIFLTVAYDRTLRYLSKEFLRYCHYLNTNRIGALSVNAILTEDPSTIVENSYVPQWAEGGNRFKNIFREIQRELGYPQSLLEYNCTPITNEEDLCRALAFDVLPYCMDVLQINPYNTSERLLRYAGKDGRCPHKNLLMGWFAQ